MLLGDKIKLEIELLDYKNPYQFAIDKDINYSTVLALTSNKNKFGLGVLNEIANALGLYLHELLEDVDIEATLKVSGEDKRGKRK